MPRSAEQISRRAAKKRERAVLPADRLPLVRLLGWLPTRLQLGIGVLRKHLRLIRLSAGFR